MIRKTLKYIADNLHLISAAIFSLKETIDYNLFTINKTLEERNNILEKRNNILNDKYIDIRHALSAICQNVYNENIRVEEIKELIKECFPKEND